LTKAQDTQIKELTEQVRVLTGENLGTLANLVAQEEPGRAEGTADTTYLLKRLALLRIDSLTESVERAQRALEAHDGTVPAHHYRLKEKVEAAQATLNNYMEGAIRLLSIQPETVVREHVRIVKGSYRGNRG
jgi:hypothetical protein